jgi:hypothetical protein
LAGHGFAFAGPSHDAKAADRAFARVLATLALALGPDKSEKRAEPGES